MKPVAEQSVSGRIAFIEKVFLKKRHHDATLRGVEIFNLNLIRELGGLGYNIDVVAEKSWREVFEPFIGEMNSVHMLYIPQCLHPSICAVVSAFALMHGRHRSSDTLIIGNVGNGLIPAIRMLFSTHTFSRMILIAHRETSVRFLNAIARFSGHVVSVCGKIAEPFAALPVAASVCVDYGIMNAGDFYPSSKYRPSERPIRFCVLGALDNAWKGADTAVAAFRKLPAKIHERAELHLMAFKTEPNFIDDNRIHIYGWQNSGEIASFLRDMDVMIVPSRDEKVMRETFSQATVQGMLTGLPIIFSSLPVLEEKFDKGGGIRFASSEELTEAMIRLADNSELRAKLGEEARKTALERYVWNTRAFAEKYISAEPYPVRK